MPDQPPSVALHERALAVFPAGSTRSALWYPPYPTYAAHGLGSRITDVDGREYLDLANNLGVLIHGHAFAPIVQAVQEQAALGSCFALPTESEIALAELLTDRVAGFEKIRFINTGSEAVALAIKAARAYTGRRKIVKLEGVYHGSYDYAEISNYSTPDNWGNEPHAVATVPATPEGVLSSVLITQANDISMLKRILASDSDIAAVIVDPVPARCGLTPLQPSYLDALRTLTREAGVLLIFDEVIALRFGYGGAQGRFGGQPDLTALGKIIGGGYPVGAVAGRADVMEATASAVSSSGTFTANPITMTAGLAGMSALDEAAYDALEALGARMRLACTEIIDKKRASMQVSGTGSMFSIYFHRRDVHDYRSYFKSPAENAATTRFHRIMLQEGVLMAPTATCFFSTAVTRPDEEHFLQAFATAVADFTS
ncbi:MAG: aspartate aminotransferase family protein [Pseudomonadaceae bacterium]|nr:aspartate aminotransferase family protein [Pseudomonadaceae bacterium]